VSGVNGILLVDKPVGMTSADVIRHLKRALRGQTELGKKEKIGHLGTLDPFASGLLPICMGTGTKIAQFLMAENKAYIGTIRFGLETDTLDATGTTTHTAPVPPMNAAVLRDLEQRFCGEILQTPPMYSAIKKNGVPLYKLARQGVVIEREARPVFIHAFTLTEAGADTLDFHVSCSKGTYIRTLAADIGTTLSCGAHLINLRRTAFGPFGIEETQPLSSVCEQLEQGEIPLLSLSQALHHYDSISLSAQAVKHIRNGQQEVLQEMRPASRPQEIVQLLAPDGSLIAIAEQHQKQWRLARVL
jgi:tRNA pseudouridine55 synthase